MHHDACGKPAARYPILEMMMAMKDAPWRIHSTRPPMIFPSMSGVGVEADLTVARFDFRV
jgi:hypothetical protein